MKSVLQVGSLVKVSAGRDAGGYCIVSELVGERYIMTIDGSKRTKDKPKLRNVMHVKGTGLIVEEVINSYSAMTDAEINRVMLQYVRRLSCQKTM